MEMMLEDLDKLNLKRSRQDRAIIKGMWDLSVRKDPVSPPTDKGRGIIELSIQHNDGKWIINKHGLKKDYTLSEMLSEKQPAIFRKVPNLKNIFASNIASQSKKKIFYF